MNKKKEPDSTPPLVYYTQANQSRNTRRFRCKIYQKLQGAKGEYLQKMYEIRAPTLDFAELGALQI